MFFKFPKLRVYPEELDFLWLSRPLNILWRVYKIVRTMHNWLTLFPSSKFFSTGESILPTPRISWRKLGHFSKKWFKIAPLMHNLLSLFRFKSSSWNLDSSRAWVGPKVRNKAGPLRESVRKILLPLHLKKTCSYPSNFFQATGHSFIRPCGPPFCSGPRTTLPLLSLGRSLLDDGLPRLKPISILETKKE